MQCFNTIKKTDSVLLSFDRQLCFIFVRLYFVRALYHCTYMYVPFVLVALIVAFR